MNRMLSVGALVYIALMYLYRGYTEVDLGPVDVTTTQMQLGGAGLSGLLAAFYPQIWAFISKFKLPSIKLPFTASGVERLVAELGTEEVKAVKAGDSELVKELTEARLALLKRVAT